MKMKTISKERKERIEKMFELECIKAIAEVLKFTVKTAQEASKRIFK